MERLTKTYTLYAGGKPSPIYEFVNRLMRDNQPFKITVQIRYRSNEPLAKVNAHPRQKPPSVITLIRQFILNGNVPRDLVLLYDKKPAFALDNEPETQYTYNSADVIDEMLKNPIYSAGPPVNTPDSTSL